MYEFKDVTFPLYTSYCTENLAHPIPDEVMQGNISVKILPIPASDGMLHFEVESLIKLGSVPGV